jgi:hypothetical protein
MLGNVVAAGKSASFNGDGKHDVLARNFRTGELFVFPHSGSLHGLETFGAPVRVGTGFRPDNFVWIGAGDFTGDGRADVYAITSDNRHLLYRNTNGLADGGPRTGPLRVSWPVSNLVLDTFTLADLDGDGRTDCLCREAGTGRIYAFHNRGIDSAALWSAPEPLVTISRGDWPLGVMSPSGNGDSALATRRADGELALYPLTGDHPAGTSYRVSAGWHEMKLICLTDLDDDGRTDLLGVNLEGTVLAYIRSHEPVPGEPFSMFHEPVPVAVGWHDFDFIG